jgi:hypothetical protein
LDTLEASEQAQESKLSRDFDELVYSTIVAAMKQILGESGTAATLFHLKLKKGSKFDPDEFHDKLIDMFHAGSLAIEKVIIKELYITLEIQAKERPGYNFQRHIELAAKVHKSRTR